MMYGGNFPITNMLKNFWLERNMNAKLGRDAERDYPSMSMYYPQQYVLDDKLEEHGSVWLTSMYLTKYNHLYKKGCHITGTVFVENKPVATFTESPTGFNFVSVRERPYGGFVLDEKHPHPVESIEVNKDCGFVYVTWKHEVKSSHLLMSYEVDLECS